MSRQRSTNSLHRCTTFRHWVHALLTRTSFFECCVSVFLVHALSIPHRCTTFRHWVHALLTRTSFFECCVSVFLVHALSVPPPSCQCFAVNICRCLLRLLLTLSSSKTEFLVIGLKRQLSIIG